MSGTLYGGGNLAAVNGNTIVSVAGTVKKDVYGGGNGKTPANIVNTIT